MKVARVISIVDAIISRICMLICLLALIFAGYCLYDTWRIYQRADTQQFLSFRPNIEDTEQEDAGFKALCEKNQEVIAWISIPDTKIDYPICQGTDNVKYVNTDVFGEFSLSGALFLDYRSDSEFSKGYMLIYGHHMENDKMLGGLDHYLEKDYLENHSKGTLYLKNGEVKQIHWFAAVTADAYDSVFFGSDYVSMDRADGTMNLGELKSHINDQAVRKTGDSIGKEDALIALSTCSDGSTNARTLLFGCMEE